MTVLRFTLRPATPFGTPLVGETLFGQLCWAVLRLGGRERLEALLEGYLDGRPYAVLSDAFPKGFIPLPTMPSFLWEAHDELDRKYLKKKAWLSLEALGEPRRRWRDLALTDAEAAARFSSGAVSLKTNGVRMHNTINRRTLTTGTGVFAPYAQPQTWLAPHVPLTVQAVVDEARFSREELHAALTYVGLAGFGRDATIGLGKFTVEDDVETLAAPQASTTHVTLASAVLSAVPGVKAEGTYYKAKTHFGRHGDALALSGAPFKRPVLLAAGGALVETAEPLTAEFLGAGVGGVSQVQPQAVHQGYAPVLSI